MKVNRSGRYCRCGTLLARDNARPHCASCQAKARDLFMGPPDMPPAFWGADQMRDALMSWHMGRVIAAYRNHPYHGRPLAQELVAGWVGITQAQLSRIENGSPIKDLDKLIQWARILRIPAHLLWFKLPEEQGRLPGGVAESARPVSAPSWGETPFSVAVPAQANENDHAAAMRSFRAADRQVGGGYLYATVMRYLHVEVAPQLFGDGQGGEGPAAFAAAGALTEMCGWMAHDAGQDNAALQHFQRSRQFANLADDRQLDAHIFASLSHLSHHMGRTRDAVQFAHRGRAALAGGPRQPELEARLLAMHARGLAVLRRSKESAQCLMEAERVLTLPPEEELSPWVSRFDEGALASESARCLLELGDLRQARRQAERIIALRPGDRTRSRAFGQLLLVTVLVAQGEPDEACAVAEKVLDATQQLGSYLVIQQLAGLRRLLEPYRVGSGTVAAFVPCLEEALRERLWLYRWLSKGRGETGHGL
jgi:transcriptional regulator with XRE-family HTH domain